MTSSKSGVRELFRNASSFVLGSAVGASAALAARGRRRQRKILPGGLSAFDDAPCHIEARERKQQAV
ncbi:MAG: hypothetical protein WBQ14_08385 [Gaiellaceae bacterium]